MFPRSIERPHPALVARVEYPVKVVNAVTQFQQVAQERRAAQRRLLIALNEHLWPKVIANAYGPHATLHLTDYLNVPSIFVRRLLLPIPKSELMSI
jgi:hypothetical protein